MRPTVLLIASTLLLLGCQPGSSGGNQPRTLQVSGSAEVKARPDQAGFTVAVVTEGEQSDAVLSRNSKITEEVLAALRATDTEFEQLRTRGVSLSPQWASRARNSNNDSVPRIIGYQARNQIEVATAQLDQVGILLAAAASAGANDIGSLNYSLQDDQQARDTAIEQATARALNEARTLAAAADVEIAGVRELRVDGSRPGPMMMRSSMDASAEMSQVPTEPGEISVNAEVSVTLDIR